MFLNYIFRLKNSIIFYLKKVYILFYSIEFKKFGKNSIVWFPIKIYGKANVSIGDNCGINAFVHIWGGGGVEIGNNVMIASHVSITSLTHDYNCESMRFSEVVRKKVIIEDDVWIGSGAIVLPGIKIGKGAVVGAGSVLTRDVPEFTIVAGNPAKVLKKRNIQSRKES